MPYKQQWSEHTIDSLILRKNIQLLIFDCDGTLMETLALHYKSWNETFQAYGYKFIDENEFITEYAGVSGGEMVLAVMDKFNYSLDSSVLLAYKKKTFLEKYILQVKPIEKTLAIAKKYRGKLKMVIASGGSKDAVIKMLILNEILELFNQVIAIEDVACGKPAPDIFLKAAESHGVLPANCLVFEDHLAGFTAAKNAGMIYIDVNELL